MVTGISMTMQSEEGMVDARAIRDNEAITHNGHGVSNRSPIAGNKVGGRFQHGIGGG
jgi:hypothetical protein